MAVTGCAPALPGGTAISNPSSPVYPDRATKHSTPHTSIVREDMNDMLRISALVRDWSTAAALGPCSARIPLWGRVSMEQS
eukprot:scaffold15942_cov51-Isochrysis_galbana.AAC.1